MSLPPPSAVTYVGLPIGSGGAHSLGRTPRRVAYERTASFLQQCTIPVRAPEFAFDVQDVPELPRNRSLERALQEAFGRGRHVVVHEARVGDALNFLDSIDPQPTNQWGMPPIWFTWTVHFQILDPES